MRSRPLTLAVAALALTAQHARAQTLAVRAETLLPVSSAPVHNAVILIRDGRIVAAGAGIRIPAGMKTIAAKVVMPGLIDAHSYLGCWNETEEPVDSITPDLRACDAFDPSDPAVQRAVRAGVTTVCVMPGNGNAVAGQAAVIRLGGATPQTLLAYAGQKLSISEDAAGPQRNPTSRAGALALVRSALLGARSGVSVSSSRQTRLLAGDTPTGLDARQSALRPVLSAQLPVFIHAPGADDADLALKLAAEFHLKVVLLHANRAAVSIEPARARGLSVVLGPLGFTDTDRTMANAGRLADLGARIAFCTDAPLSDPASLRMSARLAVQHGLKQDVAIRALTLTAAEILGVADRTGSISAGKSADLLLLDGDPLDLTSRVMAVVSAGHVVYERGGR